MPRNGIAILHDRSALERISVPTLGEETVLQRQSSARGTLQGGSDRWLCGFKELFQGEDQRGHIGLVLP